MSNNKKFDKLSQIALIGKDYHINEIILGLFAA